MFKKSKTRKLTFVHELDVIYGILKMNGDKYIPLSGDYYNGEHFKIPMDLEYAKSVVKPMNEVIEEAEAM